MPRCHGTPRLLQLAAAAAAAATVGAGACSSASPFTVAAGGGGCVDFPLIADLPRGPFYIRDSYPMPYFVTAPCSNVTRAQTNCTSFADQTTAAPAWADSAGECYALGHDGSMVARLLTPGDVHGGVGVSFSGGVGGRAVTFHLTCDPDAIRQGPSHAVEGGLQGYTVVWPTSAVCAPKQVPAAECPSVPDPKPSTELLLYQEMEVRIRRAAAAAAAAALQHPTPPPLCFTRGRDSWH